MNTLRQIQRGEGNVDFVARARKVILVSAAIIVLGLVALIARGLNLGIEFEGGVVWEIPATEGLTEDDVADKLSEFGQDGRIQRVTGGTDIFRVRAEATDFDQQQVLTEELAALAGVEVNDLSVTEVGPSWGDRVTSEARTALIWFFVLIASYIALRFEWKMAVAALVAVAHDIIVSVGLYALLQLDVTPATVIAFLTIMGYSLYDTLVVFDRVRENTAAAEKTRTTYDALMNVSMNQVIMRSINTTITSAIPVLSMLIVGSFILGAAALQEFAVALLVGIVVGTYSSVFVAGPVLVWLKNREPEWQRRTELAERNESADSILEARQALMASRYSRTQAPRPRKKGRVR